MATLALEFKYVAAWAINKLTEDASNFGGITTSNVEFSAVNTGTITLTGEPDKLTAFAARVSGNYILRNLFKEKKG